MSFSRFLMLANFSIIVSLFASIIYYYLQNTAQQPNESIIMPSEFQQNLTTTMSALQQELEQNPLDPNSFARPDQAKVIHLVLKLSVNFDKNILDGSVILTVKKSNPAQKYLLLDTVDLMIYGVYQSMNDSQNKQKIAYKLYPPVPDFGSKLEVEIDDIDGEEFKIQIDYRTNSTSRALMWMTPEQTEGKKHPFMYSQCQAINARALLPCQDTPSVKATYSAEIQCPKELQALMSAKIVRDPQTSADGQQRTHFFHQKVPIPSYLIAIAVGNLVGKRIGKISHVWSEPGLIERAAWEFEEIDSILKAAEHFAGPYVWDVYDILVLPPSFPYGGMENPCLTFATPTILAGDRSLVYVIAHEISHSWTGNLVTNANFGHFWLNEGFTTFLERKIGGYLDENGEKMRQFQALEGLNDLKSAVQYYGERSPFTKLLIDVRGINPDDVFSSIPYEKGHTFLFFLEQKLGGPNVFEPFLKAYIDKFKYLSIMTEDFQQYLLDYFKNDPDKMNVLQSIDWTTWLHGPGMPPTIPNYDRTLLMVSVDLATKWLVAPIPMDVEQFPKKDFTRMQSTQQKLFFVQLANRLNESQNFVEKLPILFKQYELHQLKNCEIQHAWIMLGLQARYEGVIQSAVNFLNQYGRMKYVVPLYREMYQWNQTKQLALDTFQANLHKMMRVAIEAISKDLKPKKSMD